MIEVKSDLHIHTVLSPCGDLDMSPANIIQAAKEKELNVIGITDHNSTRQAELIKEYAEKEGIFVMTGVEVNTSEEAHCLVFLPAKEELQEFQSYLDLHIPPILNKPDKFGYQVVADINGNILFEEKKLLISALDQNIEQVEKKVRELNGIFIPAHIDKSRFSILSQLGFIPKDLNFDALEISKNTNWGNFINRYPTLKGNAFLQSSDAHYVEEIGIVYNRLCVDEISFEGIRNAIQASSPDKTLIKH